MFTILHRYLSVSIFNMILLKSSFKCIDAFCQMASVPSPQQMIGWRLLAETDRFREKPCFGASSSIATKVQIQKSSGRGSYLFLMVINSTHLCLNSELCPVVFLPSISLVPVFSPLSCFSYLSPSHSEKSSMELPSRDTPPQTAIWV